MAESQYILALDQGTTSSRAMRWLDLPAASSRSTASSRPVSGSARPGGGTVPAWPHGAHERGSLPSREVLQQHQHRQ